MLTRLIQFISRLTRSRYTRALEDELFRLRAENRALVNSILGIAGIPPLRLDAELARDHRIAAPAAASNPAPLAASSRWLPAGVFPRRSQAPSSSQSATHATASAPRTIVPPASVAARASAAPDPAAGADLSAASSASAASARAPRPNRVVLPANALRRRSWQQIGRMLEIADARRLANRDNSGAMS